MQRYICCVIVIHDAVCVLVLDMGILCMASKEVNRYIMDYVCSQPWKNKMLRRNFHYSTAQENNSTIQHYRDLSESAGDFASWKRTVKQKSW